MILLWISFKLLREEEESEHIDASDNLVQAVKTIVIRLRPPFSRGDRTIGGASYAYNREGISSSGTASPSTIPSTLRIHVVGGSGLSRHPWQAECAR